MASKIQVDVSLDPAVVRGVVEGLVQVNEVVLEPYPPSATRTRPGRGPSRHNPQVRRTR
jgi:hypothetical protein